MIGGGTVVPAPWVGDYRSAKAAAGAFRMEAEFRLVSPGKDCGRYCTIRDFQPGASVNVRYYRGVMGYERVVPVDVPQREIGR